MSKSRTKPQLTKAGIVLSAEARSRLQQLADWLEREQKVNQNPRVQLQYGGGIHTDTFLNVTYVTPFGALVQMFDPYRLSDAEQRSPCVYSIPSNKYSARFQSILGIDHEDFLQLLRYVYNFLGTLNIDTDSIVKALRTLK